MSRARGEKCAHGPLLDGDALLVFCVLDVAIPAVA